uniref:Tetraspanin-5 n=1 Tax=Panagrellus redivivus TaxID=6233 RepID=A0A7E4W8I8_PANRE
MAEFDSRFNDSRVSTDTFAPVCNGVWISVQQLTDFQIGRRTCPERTCPIRSGKFGHDPTLVWMFFNYGSFLGFLFIALAIIFAACMLKGSSTSASSSTTATTALSSKRTGLQDPARPGLVVFFLGLAGPTAGRLEAARPVVHP